MSMHHMPVVGTFFEEKNKKWKLKLWFAKKNVINNQAKKSSGSHVTSG